MGVARMAGNFQFTIVVRLNYGLFFMCRTRRVPWLINASVVLNTTADRSASWTPSSVLLTVCLWRDDDAFLMEELATKCTPE